MANTKAMLIDASTRHAVFVNRYSGGQLRQMLPYIQRVKKSTAATLSSGELTEFSRKRLQRLYHEMEGINAAIFEKMGKKLKGNMQKFASYEADFTARMYTGLTNAEWDVPAKNQIHAAIFSDPIPILAEKDLNIDDLLVEFSSAKNKQLVTLVQDGVIAGKTNSDIIKDMGFLIDTKMADGLQAMVRTVTNHVSSVSRNELMKENEDILDGYEWVSTLDNKTTEICQALDGKVFKDGQGPRPPAHFGCRSTTIPVVKAKYSIKGAVEGLTRPAIGPDGVESVPSKQNYGEWLKTQPASFQDEVLGPTKGALFRDGGLTLDKFLDKNYKPLSVGDLRDSDKKYIIDAFKKAGIEQ